MHVQSQEETHRSFSVTPCGDPTLNNAQRSLGGNNSSVRLHFLHACSIVLGNESDSVTSIQTLQR